MALTPKDGWLYFLRDQDHRTGVVSSYVKIGLTNADRPVIVRVQEHQTGNPRRIFSSDELKVNAVDDAETHLHHLWALNRIRGEWFEMDDAQVKKAVQQAKDFNKAVANRVTDFETIAVQSKLHSNGKTRAATQDEIDLLAKLFEAKKKHMVAASKVKLFNEQIRKIMANSKGIVGVCELQSKVIKSSINYVQIKKDNEALVAKYTTTEMKLSASPFKADYTNPQLKGLDENLDQEIKAVKKGQVSEKNPANFTDKPESRTAAIEKIHQEYLASLGLESTLSIEVDLLAVAVKAAIREFDQVDGLGKWIRADKAKDTVDWKQFTLDHPTIIEANINPEKHIVAMVVNPHRSY